MRKAILGLAAIIAATVTAIPTPSEAHWRGRGWGIGAGILGGLAAGAFIGSAWGYPGYGYYRPGPYYGYRYRYRYGYAPAYYGYGPGYYAYGGPYYPYGCYRRRVWTPYGWRWRRFC